MPFIVVITCAAFESESLFSLFDWASILTIFLVFFTGRSEEK